MDKLITAGVTNTDELFAEVVHPGAPLVKEASAVCPEIQKCIAGLKSAPGKMYILVNALGAGEFYGCFVAGTLVRSGTGAQVPIETLAVGDTVVDRLGRSAAVTHTYSRHYTGPGVRFRASGMLSPVTCTHKHAFWVIKREQVRCAIDAAAHCKPGTCRTSAICTERSCQRTEPRYYPEWVEAQDLRPGDYVTVPVPDRGVGTRTWAWSVPLARTIGYFLAEGSFIKTKKSVTGMSFTFNADEADTLAADLIAQLELLEPEYDGMRVYGPYFNDADGSCTVQVLQRTLAMRVRGAVGEYSASKHLGGEVYWQTPAVLANLLAAYIDGDGTHSALVNKGCDGVRSRYTIGTASKALADDLQWILSRLGIVATVCLAVPATGARSDFYHVDFNDAGGAFLRGLAEKHLELTPLHNKEHSFVWNGLVCRPVREVTSVELDEPVFNLEVGEDHTYTVGNGVVAKNCNYNSDYFEEAELCPTDPEATWGYKTFLKAGVYRNHQNKNPEISYGTVICAAYNKFMHRVELVIEVDEKKCREVGHADLWARLQAGEKPSVSMGCRVAFDVCSICNHKSATKEDYCSHVKDQLGQVLPDGRKVFVRNPHPKFFDLSIVVIGADRTSYVMDKLAYARHTAQSSAALASEKGLVRSSDLVVEQLKLASLGKRAEIVKRLKATAAKVVNRMDAGEADLPDHAIEALGASGSLPGALTTSAAAGIVLKPQEFQRTVLIIIGKPDLAESYHRQGACFSPCSHVDSSVRFGDPADFMRGLLPTLLPLISERSGFGPPLVNRISITKVASRRPIQRYVKDPLLDKIAAAYNGYRVQLLEKISSVVANITERDVELSTAVRRELFDYALDDTYRVTKTAAAPVTMALLGAVPLAYFYGAHTSGSGEQDKAADTFIAKHPVLAMSVLAGLARLAMKAEESGQLEGALSKLVRH